MFDFLLRPLRRNFGRDKEYYRQIDDMFGFIPNNIELYKLALIHKSASFVLPDGSQMNNERLEYLGDAIIEAVTSDYLYIEFPDKPEGFLTQLRSKIVSRHSLNLLAERIGLDRLLVAHAGATLAQKHIYGDAFEAMIGAIYLDQGYDFTNRLLINFIYANYLDMDTLSEEETDFKSRLIEWCQKNHHTIRFETKHTSSNQFLSTIFIDDMEIAHGRGTSKKESEQHAAQTMAQTVTDSACLRMLDKLDKIDLQDPDALLSPPKGKKKSPKREPKAESKGQSQNEPGGEKTDAPAKKPEKAEKAPKPEKPEKEEKASKPEKAEKPKRSERPEKADKEERGEKNEKGEKSEKEVMAAVAEAAALRPEPTPEPTPERDAEPERSAPKRPRRQPKRERPSEASEERTVEEAPALSLTEAPAPAEAEPSDNRTEAEPNTADKAERPKRSRQRRAPKPKAKPEEGADKGGDKGADKATDKGAEEGADMPARESVAVTTPSVEQPAPKLEERPVPAEAASENHE